MNDISKITVDENVTGVIADLDCGEGDNPDAGLDICAVTDKDTNGFGEDTEKPTSYVLTLGEELTSEINSSQGDKLEVGAVMPGDDGDGSYYIVVSKNDDPTDTNDLFFSGIVAAGDSFVADGTGDTSFGSETFVHIFASEGGAPLQTINFHTSCSAPLVIGDQYGSITLEGASLEGKDSGTIYTVGLTEADGDAGVVYEITGGSDADDFVVDADTGEVTFLNTPDFENPTDSDGDNKYDVEVTAFEVDAHGVKTGEICEVKQLEVCVEDDCINVLENTSPVIADLDCGEGDNPDAGLDICAVTDKDTNGFGEDTEKPTSYVLTLGEELTSEINSSQGDKLEVGAVMPGDDGDGSYYIVVSKNDDPTDTNDLFFSGIVAAGDSFVADGTGDTSFGSETFVHIFASEGGAPLQTINFHTSCSAPLVIGDQYGSITLEGASLEGKDSGTIYTVGLTEADGDAGVVYEITGGSDADDFVVDADTGEVTFLNTPDFENPTDSDGDNKYDVEVTAFEVDAHGVKTGEICEVKQLEVCVEDDCINVLENTSPVIADLDCGEGDNPDAGLDICAVTDKDTNGFGEDTEKPTSYVLTLGEELTSEINSSQGDKLEVGAVMPGDDGDGSYYIVVSKNDDPTDTNDLFFSGIVAAGDSFVADGTGDTSFGSETFVHIFASEGGAPLQTINFHTSCSAPLVIGDQYGSITLEGASLEGKDSGTIYTVGLTEADGDAGVVYEITGGSDADDFVVDADTGEVTFLNTPDFENPTDSDGDNKYDVEVTAFEVDAHGVKTGEICEVKQFEVCVEDQDCISILENTDPGVIADLDCEEQDENPDLGKEICAERDALRDQGIDADKPNQLTLTLNDDLTSVIDSAQEGGKLEVDTFDLVNPDGGGLYILVSDDDDPGKLDTVYFSGDVNFGQSFTAFASAAGDDKFSSETFIHIFNADGGKLLQTINYHTSCSAPITIGDQLGLVSLDGVGLFNKDDGSTIEFGGSVAREVVYEITGGDGFDDVTGTSPFFDVDPATGEVTLAFTPDFENPLDDNADNNYFVEVTGYFVNDDGSREVCEVKPIEICIEDEVEVGSLSGRYFCDTNDNDVDDGQLTDPGIAGVVVTAFDADGTEVGATATDAQGNYQITGLPEGTYSVVFTDPNGVLDGKQLVNANVGGNDAIDSDAIGDTTMSVIEGIVVNAGADTPDNDAGAEKTASLGDKVFFDTDRDGIQDVGEAGVEGVTVTLTGGGEDGVIGTGDDDTTTVKSTDANGNYLFEDLDPGTEYKVTFSDLPAGTEFTTPNQGGDDAADSDADPTNGMTEIVTLAPGEENLTLDAGIVSKLGSLSGRYFCDENDNDVDDGEPGIEGVTVELLAAGVVIATTTTGADGSYSFGDLEAGTYDVKFTDPTGGVLDGKQLVNANVGGNDAIDSDAIGDTTMSVIEGIVVNAGADTPDNDAGAEKTASLGDKVFFDTDRDGIQDVGEAGVEGVTVTLTGGGEDGVIGTGDDDTTTVKSTDANGNYLFEDLDPGTEYKVTFSDLPAGTEFTTPNQGGDDAADSDADPTNGMTEIVTLAPGEENLTLDAGIVSKLGSLSGRYFCDENDNDVDDGEPGIEGVTVELLAAGVVIATTTTGADGSYSFGDLEAGTYDVKFTDPTGGVLDGKQLVNANVGGNDAIDSDAIGDTTMSVIEGIVVNAGADTPDNDAGAEKTASLGDKVFFDTDRDGIQDVGEAGVEGVTVTLTGGGEDGVIGTGDDDTTTVKSTDANGNYLFEDLDPGTEYKVTFSDLPAGTEFTTPNQGGDDAADSDADPTNGMTEIVTLAPGEENLTLDAGIVSKLGSLSGRYFCDENDNDVDDGEPGIEGVTVELLAAGVVIATTTTGADGSYSFGDLEAGTYDVKFTDPTRGVLDGKQLVNANVGGNDAIDSDAIGDTTMSVIEGIVVNAGADTPDNDAGAEKTASLGDKVFFDTDRDGIQDVGEAGVEGVTVTLTGGGEDGVIGTGDDDTTTVKSTDANGNYLFEDLDPGTEYKVTFSDLPAGTEFTTPNQGGDDAADSDADPTNGMTEIVTLAPGEENLTLDAGIVSKLGSLSGRYFCDDDRDGLDNDGVDSTGTPDGSPSDGIEGVTVTLLDASGNPTSRTTTTDFNGNYAFTGLVAGTYGVLFTDSVSGKQLTTQDVGDDDGIDSDAAQVGDPANGISEILGITVVAGANTPDNDAGVFPNDAPDITDDMGKGCADEDIKVDFSDNYSDVDSASVGITMIGGLAINAGDTITVIDSNGREVEVTLTADDPMTPLVDESDVFIFNGETAYADLDIGEEATANFEVKVEDSDGGFATASIEVTFCGDANSVDSLYASLPTGGTYEVEYALDEGAPFPEYAFDLRFLDTGDARFDGVLFEQAYCLDFETAVRTIADNGPDNIGIIFGSQSDRALDAFDPNTVSTANGLAGAENLDLINWVIAQDFEGQGSSGWEVQIAVWSLADDFDITEVNYAAFENTDLAGVQNILTGALALAGASDAGVDSFEFEVGDTIGIIVDPEPHLVDPDPIAFDPDNIQPFIVALDWETYDCLC